MTVKEGAPASFQWVNPSGGSFNTAANWIDQNGQPTTAPTPSPTPAPTPTPTPTPTLPPPVVVLGGHWQNVKLAQNKKARVLVVSFSGALDPGDAANLTAYRLDAAGRDKKFGTRHDKIIPMAQAAYNSAQETVTLTPRGTVPNQTLELTINATLVLDARQRPIDGNGDGRPGGNFVATLTRNGALTSITTRAAEVFRRR